MRLLLDTHALLWALATPRRLPRAAAAAIADPSNAVFVSAASIWEMTIKTGLGKLDADPALVWRAARDTGFVELPISIGHGLKVRELADHHRDPFDRLLIAQALAEGLAVVSQDEAFAAYPVASVWK